MTLRVHQRAKALFLNVSEREQQSRNMSQFETHSFRLSVKAVDPGNRAAAYPNKEDIKLLAPGSAVIVLLM